MYFNRFRSGDFISGTQQEKSGQQLPDPVCLLIPSNHKALCKLCLQFLGL